MNFLTSSMKVLIIEYPRGGFKTDTVLFLVRLILLLIPLEREILVKIQSPSSFAQLLYLGIHGNAIWSGYPTEPC